MLIPEWVWLTLGGYLLGAIPFALVVGRLAQGVDIRQYGDGNPGATNVLRAGGKKGWGIFWFVVTLILEISKGAIPVGYAYFILRLTEWPMVVVALAPVVGHALSPFLGFRGGKAVAVTGGMLIGMTIWEGITVGGLLLWYWSRLLKVSGWMVMFAYGTLLIYLAIRRVDPVIMAAIVGNMILLGWTHRKDLRQAPGLQEWYKAAVRALPFWRRS